MLNFIIIILKVTCNIYPLHFLIKDVFCLFSTIELPGFADFCRSLERIDEKFRIFQSLCYIANDKQSLILLASSCLEFIIIMVDCHS